MAKEIADKLERDLQEQQQKELQQSELIAQKMQVCCLRRLREVILGYSNIRSLCLGVFARDRR